MARKSPHREQTDPPVAAPMPAPAETGSIPDPFALENLVVDQSYIQASGVKRVRTTVPILEAARARLCAGAPEPRLSETVFSY